MHIEPPGAVSILAIAAHPDDIESWCAGTLSAAIDRGAMVRLLQVTSGDKGSSVPGATTEEVARVRESEALGAARILGITDVTFLRHPDGEVEDSRALRGEIVGAIRRLRPAVLFTHDPEHPYPPYLTHRDHRVVGRAVLDAAYPLSRDRLSFPEHEGDGLAPHAVKEIWLFASAIADAHIDISTTFDRKIRARLVHASQTVEVEALRRSWQERAARVGAPAGLGLAEAFKVLHLD
jgi:LmbE family N-acetylglucosaminyl deacetylase